MIPDQGHHFSSAMAPVGAEDSWRVSATDKGDHHGDTGKRQYRPDLGVNPGNDREGRWASGDEGPGATTRPGEESPRMWKKTRFVLNELEHQNSQGNGSAQPPARRSHVQAGRYEVKLSDVGGCCARVLKPKAQERGLLGGARPVTD